METIIIEPSRIAEIKETLGRNFESNRWSQMYQRVEPFLSVFSAVILCDVRMYLLDQSSFKEVEANSDFLADFTLPGNTIQVVNSLDRLVEKISNKYIASTLAMNLQTTYECYSAGKKFNCIAPNKQDCLKLIAIFKKMLKEHQVQAQHIELFDDDTSLGGISYVGYTLDDYLADTNIGYDVLDDERQLNEYLHESGIRPVSLN